MNSIIMLEKVGLLGQTEERTLKLDTRLPNHLESPCLIHCQFKLEQQEDYYVLSLKVNSTLSVICQRCLSAFSYPYQNATKLAITSSE